MPRRAALDAFEAEVAVGIPLQGHGKLKHRAAFSSLVPAIAVLMALLETPASIHRTKFHGRDHGVKSLQAGDGTKVAAEAATLKNNPGSKGDNAQDNNQPCGHLRGANDAELLVGPCQNDKEKSSQPEIAQKLGKEPVRPNQIRGPFIQGSKGAHDAPQATYENKCEDDPRPPENPSKLGGQVFRSVLNVKKAQENDQEREQEEGDLQERQESLPSNPARKPADL